MSLKRVSGTHLKLYLPPKLSPASTPLSHEATLSPQQSTPLSPQSTPVHAASPVHSPTLINSPTNVFCVNSAEKSTFSNGHRKIVSYMWVVYTMVVVVASQQVMSPALVSVFDERDGLKGLCCSTLKQSGGYTYLPSFFPDKISFSPIICPQVEDALNNSTDEQNLVQGLFLVLYHYTIARCYLISLYCTCLL